MNDHYSVLLLFDTYSRPLDFKRLSLELGRLFRCLLTLEFGAQCRRALSLCILKGRRAHYTWRVVPCPCDHEWENVKHYIYILIETGL
jgi:hypothetical protein